MRTWRRRTHQGLGGKSIAYYGVHGLALLEFPDALFGLSRLRFWCVYWLLRGVGR